jgi:capsular polysaccharide biosynthesis protein
VRPIGPKKLFLIIMALVFGPVGGVVLAFVTEYLDVSLRSRGDVESHLGLPLLASIPDLKGLEQKGRAGG